MSKSKGKKEKAKVAPAAKPELIKAAAEKRKQPNEKLLQHGITLHIEGEYRTV